MITVHINWGHARRSHLPDREHSRLGKSCFIKNLSKKLSTNLKSWEYPDHSPRGRRDLHPGLRRRKPHRNRHRHPGQPDLVAKHSLESLPL